MYIHSHAYLCILHICMHIYVCVLQCRYNKIIYIRHTWIYNTQTYICMHMCNVHIYLAVSHSTPCFFLEWSLPLSAQHRLSIQGKATANITSSSLPTSCSGIHHRLFWGLVCIAPYYKYQSLFIHFCVQSTRPLGPAHSWPSLSNYKIEVGLMHGMPSASCILTTDGEGGCGVSTGAQPWLEPEARWHICL